MVPRTASSGVDMTETMGRTRSSKSAVSASETAMKSVTVLPMSSAVRRRSPAPTAWPTLTVVPMARPTIITVSMCITWEPMETAVVLATPSNWPMMKRSAMP